MYESYMTDNLASMLDGVQRLSPENSSILSHLDHGAMLLSAAYPQLIPAHRAYSAARANVWPASLTEARWQELLRTAAELATAIRGLGNIEAHHCEASTQFGTCGTILSADGTCAYAQYHSQ